MKQLLQNMRDGKTIISEVPIPAVQPGTALVRTAVSLVSAGTERMLVEFAEKSLLGKAQSRPDLVYQLMDKARREGILPTLQAAFNRLDKPIPLGYSSAGTVIAIGEGLKGFRTGDRVACAGGGYAVHAEYAVVPQNLLAALPDKVDFEQAAFTTLGAIALHGFRLAAPQLGENVAVIGLGLLGLLSVQIARAAGCRVFGIDIQPERVKLATQLGVEASLRSEAEDSGKTFTRGMGFDTILITADTRSNDPINLAGILARDRATVIAVGAVGTHLPRKLYYDKELDFKISRSYGPGRYDSNYEQKGHDYPIGYVRWSEGRNLSAFIELLADGKVDVKPLISHHFSLEDAPQAYDLITGKTAQPFLGVLLTYAQDTPTPVEGRVLTGIAAKQTTPAPAAISIGVLGAGNYASAVFLPNISKSRGIHPKGIASASGINAQHAARKYGFEYATSSEDEILQDASINAVAILTRHNDHARQVIRALQQGKAVYCEKPLAIQEGELAEIETLLGNPSTPLLMVGFNRRFARMVKTLKEFLHHRSQPLIAYYRVNAGALPRDHWLHDPLQGGGRIIGEGCHFIDLLTFLVGALPVRVSAHMLPDGGIYRQDNAVITFTFPDGSLGTLSYLANGDKSVSKELLEVFCGGRVAILNDYRSLELIRDGKRKVFTDPLRQDKGHQSAWEAFIACLRTGGTPPIPYSDLVGVTRASFAAIYALQRGETVSVP